MSHPREPSTRWKRFLTNLGLSVATFALCFGLLELSLRLAGYGNLEIYEPHPLLYWRLKPNQECFTKVGRQPVRINSHGTRGPEFTIAKPAGTMRILSLGDSRTFGWGLAEQDTFSAKLVTHLNSRPASTNRIELINAGVNAWSYAQMLVYLREYGIQYQPDLVILGEANLWTQFSEKNSPEFVEKFMGRVRLKNLLRRFATYHYFVEVKLKNFYEKHRTKFIPVDPGQDPLFKTQQQADPEAVFRASLRDLCTVAGRNGARPVLLFVPTLDDLTSTNPPLVLTLKRQVAAELGVPLVDTTPLLEGPAAKALYLEADPVHLNKQGNEKVAQALISALEPLVP
jgi:hypothetical protein